MRINIVTNLANGAGLQRDYELLRQLLTGRGHRVAGVQFNRPGAASAADVNIFLEVVTPELFRFARQQWAVPNPEWWFSGWPIKSFARVLAKTRDCERIFRALAGDRCQFIGWQARDLYQPEIKRERRFLHVAGKSLLKNTAAVLEAWKRFRIPARLTVISVNHMQQARGIPGVRCLMSVTDDVLAEEVNQTQYHLMPSAYEGYGHALHEALGVGAVILTTDAPPMSELGSPRELLIPSRAGDPHHQVSRREVSPEDIAAAVDRALALSDDEIAEYSRSARQNFVKESAEFVQRLDAVLA